METEQISNCDTTLDSNENFYDECDVLETNCEASCAVDTVDEDFDQYDANVLSSRSNGNFNDYTSFLEKAWLKQQQSIKK